MVLPQIEGRLLQVIEECRTLGVPAAALEDMASLARAGEPGVALENLCVQLVEYDAAVPDALVRELTSIGIAMGLRDEYWNRLRTK